MNRYRGYTCYSDENGQLVPSVEPMEKDTNQELIKEVLNSLEATKKLNEGQPPQIQVEQKK
jgi:hypothetical protein